MRPVSLDSEEARSPDPRSQPRALGLLALTLIATVVAIAAFLFGGYLAYRSWLSDSARLEAVGSLADDVSGAAETTIVALPSSTTTAPATTSPSTTTTSVPASSLYPGIERAPYVVGPEEAVPDAKQVAADIAYSLTTYEESDDHLERLRAFRARSGLFLLAEASEPLLYIDSWSEGEVIYPQMGGLTDDAAAVMVVTRQTVGSGPRVDFSVVRTLDIRLVRGESGWEFDSLNSAGGVFADLEALALAHAVASDPRIEMPDSARLDIESGLVSPILLELMAELAERTPFGVVTLRTGHPVNVYGTERVSDHTFGRAVDIYRIGDRLVIDDRAEDSTTRAIVEWLYDHPSVVQIGSPWDLDEEQPGTVANSRRSFTDVVHQDHIHFAVIDSDES